MPYGRQSDFTQLPDDTVKALDYSKVPPTTTHADTEVEKVMVESSHLESRKNIVGGRKIAIDPVKPQSGGPPGEQKNSLD